MCRLGRHGGGQAKMLELAKTSLPQITLIHLKCAMATLAEEVHWKSELATLIEKAPVQVSSREHLII